MMIISYSIVQARYIVIVLVVASLSLWFFRLGQIELYTHHPFLPTLVQNLQRLNIRVCATYLIESQFMEDRYKFFRFAFLVFHLEAMN